MTAPGSPGGLAPLFALLLLLGGLELGLFLLVLLDELLDLGQAQDGHGGLVAHRVARQRGHLQFVGRQLGHVQRLAEHLDGQGEGVLERRLVLLVLLLEDGDCGRAVVPDARRLPAAVVAARVRLVQLVAVVLVPSHVQDGDAEGPFPAVLSVRLLEVAQPAHQALAGDRLAVLQQVPLGDLTQLVGQHVGVRGDASHAARHVVVQLVDLLGGEHFVEKLVGVSSLRSENNPVRCQDAEAGAGVPDRFHGVLDLIQSTFGAEYSGPGVVATSHGDARLQISLRHCDEQDKDTRG
uniref:Putative secreted protein n=1 Tax=Ixodes ricinus TaxID=34613 RepID=A0A6B0V6F0_IXORI